MQKEIRTSSSENWQEAEWGFDENSEWSEYTE